MQALLFDYSYFLVCLHSWTAYINFVSFCLFVLVLCLLHGVRSLSARDNFMSSVASTSTSSITCLLVSYLQKIWFFYFLFFFWLLFKPGATRIKLEINLLKRFFGFSYTADFRNNNRSMQLNVKTMCDYEFVSLVTVTLPWNYKIYIFKIFPTFI